MRKVKYEIILSEHYEDDLQYLILKSVYYFGFNLFGEIYGRDRNETPFDSVLEAEEYLKTIKK